MHKSIVYPLFFIAVLFLGSCANQVRNAALQNNSLEKYVVAPPSSQLDVPFIAKTVASDQASKITFASGSSIDIPAGIFVDENNQPVTKPVDLLFREFHTAADIIASGIPMKVRMEEGTEEWMQTAGMFELKGFCEGKEVKIATGKMLNVNLVSNVDGEYPFWYFNAESGNWEKQSQVSTAVPNPNFMSAPVVDVEVAAPPAKPIEFDPGKPALNFDINVKKLPELANLGRIIWQYAGTDAKKDPANHEWVFRHNWDDATIEPTTTPNVYHLTLVSRDSGEYMIPVCPNKGGKDLERAKAQYAQLMAEYEKGVAMLKNREQIVTFEGAFMRSMQVSGFGMHNCDVFYNMRNSFHVMADFDFGESVPVNVKQMMTVFLVTGDSRSVITVPFSAWDNFRFNINEKNKILAILPDNKLAIFDYNDFKSQLGEIKAASEQRYVFKMRVLDKPLKSFSDLNHATADAG